MFRRVSFTTLAIVALIGLGASPAGTAVTSVIATRQTASNVVLSSQVVK